MQLNEILASWRRHLRRQLPDRFRTLRWVQRALWALGVPCLAIVAYTAIDARWYAFVEGRRLDQALAARNASQPDDGGATALPGDAGSAAPEVGGASDSALPALPAATASPASLTDNLRAFVPVEPPPPLALPSVRLEEGSLIGRIEIPRLGLSELILQGVSDTSLRRGVGHLAETALPDDPNGNVGLAGHRDSVFTHLQGVHKDDVIRLETLYGTARYAVDWTRIVQPDEVGVLAPDLSRSELTLITCYPFHYIGSAPQRFVVRAHRLDGETLAARAPQSERALP